MSKELMNDITTLIITGCMFQFIIAAITVIFIFILKWALNEDVKKLKEENKYLKESIKNHTEIERLRYEHDKLIDELIERGKEK